jgi:hypothetical protein
MLAEAIPAHPDFIELAKTFGVGIATMAGWIYFLLKDLRDYKEKERVYSKELLDLSKENISTITSLTQVVEAIAPAITASSIENKAQLELAISRLKDHVTNQCAIIERALNNRQSNG